MFWKRKKQPENLFQIFIPQVLYTNMQNYLQKRAKPEPESLLEPIDDKKRKEMAGNIASILADETFNIGCIIGTTRPDILNGIFKQNEGNHESMISAARDQCKRLLKVFKDSDKYDICTFGGNFLSESLGSSGSFVKSDPINGITNEALKILGASFLMGYVFGHDNPELFMEMQKSIMKKHYHKKAPFLFQRHSQRCMGLTYLKKI